MLGTNLAGILGQRGHAAQQGPVHRQERHGQGRAEQQISLSNQIAEIVEDGGKVWIAQSPGRTKNGWTTKTHPAILRMLALALGGEKAGAEVLQWPIRAVAIRYDVNLCDGRVVAERLRGEKVARRTTWPACSKG